MIKDALVVAGLGTKVFASMFTQPNRFPERSWRSEYARRLASTLLDQGVQQSDQWLRVKEELLALKGPVFLKVHWESVTIAGVACIRCRPKSGVTASNPIVYMHGGGYVVGSANSYRYTFAQLALATGAEVIGINYHLAPEYPVALAQQDCVSVSQALIAECGSSSGMVLMGDSAGGGLALSTTLALKSLKLDQHIVGCILLSPWIEPYNPAILADEFEQDDILSAAILSRWANSLLVNGEEPEMIDFSITDFRGFPKVYIQAAGREIFLPQIDAFVARLKDASVEVQYDVFAGQFHVFQTLAPLVREADQGIAKIAQAYAEF